MVGVGGWQGQEGETKENSPTCKESPLPRTGGSWWPTVTTSAYRSVLTPLDSKKLNFFVLWVSKIEIKSLPFSKKGVLKRRPIQDEIWSQRSLARSAAAPHRGHSGHERRHNCGRLRQQVDQHLLLGWKVQGNSIVLLML